MGKKNLHIFIVVVFLFSSLKLLGEERKNNLSPFTIEHFGSENGLPQNSITTIFQTHDGYLWIGTNNGLVRYDGVKFETVVPSIRILSLFEDTKNNLWIGSEGKGLLKYSNGKFSYYITQNGLKGNDVHSIVEDSKHSLWILTDFFLTKIMDNSFFHYELPSKDIYSVFYLMVDNDDILVSSGYESFKFQNGKFVPMFEDFAKDKLPFVPFIDSKNNYWVNVHKKGIYHFSNDTTFYSEKDGLKFLEVDKICSDKENNIWFFGEYGIMFYDWKNFQIITVEDGLSDHIITSFFQDTEGTYWIGTKTGGLNKVRRKEILSYSFPYLTKSNNATSIIETKSGNILFGSNCGGVNMLTKDGSVEHILNNKKEFIGACAWSLYEDSKNNLWIGTWGDGVYKIKNWEQSLQKANSNSIEKIQWLGDLAIISMYEDSKNNLWIGTYNNGVIKIKDEKIENYVTNDGLTNNDIRTFLEDSKNNLWIGTSSGLNKYKNGKLLNFKFKNELRNLHIRSLYEDSEGTIWIGTYENGLFLMKEEKLFNFTTSDGMYDNLISHIVEDEFGYFWFGCNTGIFRVSKKLLNDYAEGKIKYVIYDLFNKGNGMLSDETNGGFFPNALKSKNGKIYFPTLKGVVEVDPRKIEIKKNIPNVLIDKFQVDTTKFGIYSNIEIFPNPKNIFISFTSPSFINANRIIFKYKLEGLDDNWNEIGNRREISFANLSPNKYVFRIAASVDNEAWGKENKISFEVFPAVYQTIWFQLFAILFFVGGVGIVFRRIELKKEKEKRHKLEKEIAVEKERLRISKDMHDDIGSKLTYIKMINEFSKSNIENTKSIQKYVDNVDSVTKETIHALSEIVWALNSKYDTLDNTIFYYVDFISKYLEDFGIYANFDIPKTIPEVKVYSDIRHNVVMIIKEALNNIMKYANASEVTIRFSYEDNIFTVEMQDDGEGFEIENVKKFSNGITNMKKRMEDIKGEFQIESKIGAGTKIKASVKI